MGSSKNLVMVNSLKGSAAKRVQSALAVGNEHHLFCGSGQVSL